MSPAPEATAEDGSTAGGIYASLWFPAYMLAHHACSRLPDTHSSPLPCLPLMAIQLSLPQQPKHTHEEEDLYGECPAEDSIRSWDMMLHEVRKFCFSASCSEL